MVKIETKKEENSKEKAPEWKFAQLRIPEILADVLRNDIKRDSELLGLVRDPDNGKALGSLCYAVVHSLIKREELKNFDFEESVLRELAHAIQEAPDEGINMLTVDQTILTKSLFNELTEAEEEKEKGLAYGVNLPTFLEKVGITNKVKAVLSDKFTTIKELRDFSEEKDLTEISGIGKTSSEKIRKAL